MTVCSNAIAIAGYRSLEGSYLELKGLLMFRCPCKLLILRCIGADTCFLLHAKDRGVGIAIVSLINLFFHVWFSCRSIGGNL